MREIVGFVAVVIGQLSAHMHCSPSHLRLSLLISFVGLSRTSLPVLVRGLTPQESRAFQRFLLSRFVTTSLHRGVVKLLGPGGGTRQRQVVTIRWRFLSQRSEIEYLEESCVGSVSQVSEGGANRWMPWAEVQAAVAGWDSNVPRLRELKLWNYETEWEQIFTTNFASLVISSFSC